MKAAYAILAASVLVVWADGTGQRASSEPVVIEPSTRARVQPAMRVAFRPVYRPPKLGAPRVTTASGTRSGREGLPRLAVLAPEHVGLTTRAQPTLFWVQSGAEKALLELTVVAVGEPEVLLELNWSQGLTGQLQRLDLSEHPLTLIPGKEYKWSVAVVRDPDRRSQDLVASGLIRRVEPGRELGERLAEAGERRQAELYAAAGIWYDAVVCVQSLMEKEPGDAEVVAAGAAWGLGPSAHSR